MSLWVARLLPRLGRWLIRKLRQVQHHMSHCGAAGEEDRPKAGHAISSPFASNSIVVPNFSPERERKHKMGTSPVSNRSWRFGWKVDHATLHAGFCLRVGEHERLATTSEFPRNAINTMHVLGSFDCRSRSNRPCAAKVQNNVCWLGIVSPMTGRRIV